MAEEPLKPGVNRRELLTTLGRAAALTVVLPPLLRASDALALGGPGTAPAAPAGGAAADPLVVLAGPDRVVVAPEAVVGRTYLNAWAGYGEPPWRRRRFRRPGETPPPEPTGPAVSVAWRRKSGPGEVSFADARSLVTTATFTAPGQYVLELTADNGESRVTSAFTVSVEAPPASEALEPVITRGYRIDSGLWNARARALTVSWIPHVVAELESAERPTGGLDNFLEAAKALRGEPHAPRKGYVFSDAYVHNAVESMCVALMVDPRGDQEIEAAQTRMRATLDDWIPKILAAREPDGYLQTAYTLRDRTRWAERWTPQGRGNHEGYTGGYFIEAGIAHHMMTGAKDTRLYDAARALADCWDAHIGPAPKQEWFDGHQEMEQALFRLARYVDAQEGKGAGERYARLARFLLDCRRGGSEYDQSHLPVVQQYEAVGHAVRAVYSYSAMADVAIQSRDPDYLSAVRSLWDSIAEKKYYVTGGVGSGETSEGFGPEYSLRNNGYCESCSSCGLIFFQAKMNRLYRDAKYADLMEDTLYNALLGSLDLEAQHYYYDNPLDTNIARYSWHSVPCCVGNIPRTLLSLPTWMYARAPDGLYINLFVGSTVLLEGVAGTDVQLVQQTDYPWDKRVKITVNPKSARRFAIRVRAPNRMASGLYRAEPAIRGITRLAVNGSAVRARTDRGYAVLDRTWQPGDVIDLVLPMRVQRVHADPRIEADRGRVALKYGPLLYNIEREDQDIEQALPRGARLTTEWRPDLFGGVTVIHGSLANGAPLLAIPNFVRGNRLVPTDLPRRPERPTDGSRPRPFPATSVVWIREV